MLNAIWKFRRPLWRYRRALPPALRLAANLTPRSRYLRLLRPAASAAIGVAAVVIAWRRAGR